MLLIPLCPRTLDIACLTVVSVWGKKGLFWLQAKPTWSAFRAKAKHTKGVDPLLTSTFPARFCYYDVVCRRQKRPSGKYAFFRSLDLCSDKPLGQLAAGGSLVKAAKEGLDIFASFPVFHLLTLALFPPSFFSLPFRLFLLSNFSFRRLANSLKLPRSDWSRADPSIIPFPAAQSQLNYPNY